MLLVQSVLARVRSRGVRFLKKDSSCNLWFEVGDKRALEKTSRALRDRCVTKKDITKNVSKIPFPKKRVPRTKLVIKHIMKVAAETGPPVKQEEEKKECHVATCTNNSAFQEASSANLSGLALASLNPHSLEYMGITPETCLFQDNQIASSSSIDYLNKLHARKDRYIDERLFLKDVFG